MWIAKRGVSFCWANSNAVTQQNLTLVNAGCSHCGEIMWALSEGIQCKECSVSIHRQCAREITKPCSSRLSLSPPRSSSFSAPFGIPASPGPSKTGTANIFTRKGIIKEGPLWKMALSDASWSHTWCVCKQDSLYVFRPEKVRVFCFLMAWHWLGLV